jgi:hypothetical protein
MAGFLDLRKMAMELVRQAGQDGKQDRTRVLNSEELVAEKLIKLKNSRSGHVGHLTYLANKISTLLTDNSNIKAVKELSVMFDRQWDRFELVHRKGN